jgi:hypothetical protein
MLVLLTGCMPLGLDDPASVPSATATSPGIAPGAPTSARALDLNGFKQRVVAAAQAAPTGTLVLVIRTTLATGALTLRYNGSYDVTDPVTPRCQIDGSQNGQPLTVIAVGDKLYTKAGTGKYVLSSASDSVARLGLATVRPDLPTLAGLLGSSVRGLTDTGPETLGSLSVEHWRALVDASVFAPSASGSTTVDLWLDSADLLRQVSYTLTSSGTGGPTTSVTLTYGDISSPVTITEPSASELR